MNNRQTGSAGENMGCAYIEELGMEVLARNWHFGHEEIDIIARDGDTTVFIEVKYRLDNRRGWLRKRSPQKTGQHSARGGGLYAEKRPHGQPGAL